MVIDQLHQKEISQVFVIFLTSFPKIIYYHNKPKTFFPDIRISQHNFRHIDCLTDINHTALNYNGKFKTVLNLLKINSLMNFYLQSLKYRHYLTYM